VIRGRRTSFSDFVDALIVTSSKDKKHELPWIQDQVDSLVFAVNSRLVDGDNDDKLAISLAFDFLNKGLDCSNFARVALRFLLERRLPDVVQTGSAPSDKFARWHGLARKAMTNIGIEAEQLDILRDLEQTAGNVLGALTHRYYLDVGIEVEKAANNVAASMRGFLNRLTADKDEIRRACNDIASVCREAIAAYALVIPFVAEPEIRKQMTEIKAAFENIRDRIQTVV